MMTTTNTTRPRKQARLGGVDPLPADMLDLAPESVREASESFRIALERSREAAAAVKDAAAAVETAHRQDRHAAAEAELTGKRIPKAATPAAEARLAEARRSAEGAALAATQRQHQFLGCLLANLADLRQRAELELEQVAPDTTSHIEAVERLTIRRSRARRLLAELGDGAWLQGRSAAFHVGSSRRRHDPLAGPLREQFDALRRQLGLKEAG